MAATGGIDLNATAPAEYLSGDSNMTIDPIDITPGPWVQDFNDNFAALQGISISPNSPLYPQWQHITNLAGSLHWQMGQWATLGKTDPNAAYAGLKAMQSQVYSWLNQVNDFASAMQGQTTDTDSITAIQNKARDWTNGFNDFVQQPITNFLPQQLQDDFRQMSDILNSLQAFVSNAIPIVAWIGVGVLALFLLPKIFDLIDGD